MSIVQVCARRHPLPAGARSCVPERCLEAAAAAAAVAALTAANEEFLAQNFGYKSFWPRPAPPILRPSQGKGHQKTFLSQAQLEHSWSSGRIGPCHGPDPGSIPGECSSTFLFCALLFNLCDLWEPRGSLHSSAPSPAIRTLKNKCFGGMKHCSSGRMVKATLQTPLTKASLHIGTTSYPNPHSSENNPQDS